MPRLSLVRRKERAQICFDLLCAHYPDVKPSLNFTNAWELLVGGVLGAQTTDVQVNKITAVMFADMPEIEDYAQASIEEIESYIKTAGLYHNKAKSLKGAAEKIMQVYAGAVPQTIEELITLPGVGRKVANLVVSDYFGKPGMVVDTHNSRISYLLGLTESQNPTVIERDLCAALPAEHWSKWGHLMVTLGRDWCKAKCRACAGCPLKDNCAYALKKSVRGTIGEAESRGEVRQCL